MLRIVLLALLCLGAPLSRADVWIGPGALSYHTDRGTRHNEVNQGLNVEYDWNLRDSVGLGVYRNSNWHETHYLAYRWTPWIEGDFRIGAVAGIADGYSANSGNLSPIAGFVAVYDRKYWGLNLLATPYTGGAVFALQIKWKIP